MGTSLHVVMQLARGCDDPSHGPPVSQRSLLAALPLLLTEVAEQLLEVLLLLLAWHLLQAVLPGVAAAGSKHHVRIYNRACMTSIHDERAFGYVPELLVSWLSKHAAAPLTAGGRKRQTHVEVHHRVMMLASGACCLILHSVKAYATPTIAELPRCPWAWRNMALRSDILERDRVSNTVESSAALVKAGPTTMSDGLTGVQRERG